MSLFLGNSAFANELLKLRCVPQNPKLDTINWLLDLKQKRVIERGVFQVNFPLKVSSSTIAWVETTRQKIKGITTLFEFSYEKKSKILRTFVYQLNNVQVNQFSKDLRREYSKTGDKVSSSLAALTKYKGIKVTYNCE